MRLVNYSEDPKNEYFLNMDLIESVTKQEGKCRAWIISSEDGYEISESAYNTILRYGKAKI
jgi:hypothetical protein